MYNSSQKWKGLLECLPIDISTDTKFNILNLTVSEIIANSNLIFSSVYVEQNRRKSPNQRYWLSFKAATDECLYDPIEQHKRLTEKTTRGNCYTMFIPYIHCITVFCSSVYSEFFMLLNRNTKIKPKSKIKEIQNFISIRRIISRTFLSAN